MAVAWALADLGEARGKQELFTRQSPQRLKALRALRSYYETLELSCRGWHDGVHDPWPYINFSLFILKTAYKEFEERLGQVEAPRGEKTELVIRAVRQAGRTFRVADIQRECPGVSLDLIRVTLKKLRAAGRVKCLGRGQSAEWKTTIRWRIG